MKLLISLSHFCEIHGPAVVFTTKQLIDIDSHYIGENVTPKIRQSHFESQDLNETNGCDDNEENGTYLFKDDEETEITPTQSDSCEGCSLHVANQQNYDFITFDSPKNIVYLTDDFPNESKSFVSHFDLNDLKIISIRALCSEIYPTNDDMIYFEDDNGNHIMSIVFTLPDSKARGFQRKYSIFVVSDQQEFLLNNWDFLNKNISLFITLIRRKAKKVLNYELNPETCLQRKTIILDKVASVETNLNYFEEIFDRDPSNTSKNKIKARSLREITGDNDIFYAMHIQFVSILKEIYKLHNPNRISFLENFDLESQVYIEQDYSLLRYLSRLIGNTYFSLVAHNIVVGSHVIVVDSGNRQPIRIKTVINGLIKLLPNSRFRATLEPSIKKINPNEYGITGIYGTEQALTIFPSDSFLCLEICNKENSDDDMEKSSNYAIKPEECIVLENCEIKVHSNQTGLKIPNLKYISDVVGFLEDNDLTTPTVGAAINSLKIELMNKCQLLCAYFKEEDATFDKITLMLEMLELVADDLIILQYWKNFLSKKYR